MLSMTEIWSIIDADDSDDEESSSNSGGENVQSVADQETDNDHFRAQQLVNSSSSGLSLPPLISSPLSAECNVVVNQSESSLSSRRRSPPPPPRLSQSTSSSSVFAQHVPLTIRNKTKFTTINDDDLEEIEQERKKPRGEQDEEEIPLSSPSVNFFTGVNHTINCFQLNMQRSKRVAKNFVQYLTNQLKLDFDNEFCQFVLMIQEPPVDKLGNPSLSEFAKIGNIYYPEEANLKSNVLFPRRTAILASNHIKVKQVMEFASHDLTIIEVDYASLDRRVLLASSYMHAHNVLIPTKNLKNLINYCDNNYISLVLATDCNSLHRSWTGSSSNGRGNRLYRFFQDTGITVHNFGGFPTSVRSSSIIDLTLTNLNSGPGLLRGWHVVKRSDELIKSDHRLIRFYINI